MKVLDLFSGIGGFSLGLERAGMETVAFCEIDPFCREVLKKHWPNVKQYEDIRSLTKENLNNDGVGTIDIITGGFPCQDLSQSGRKGGIEAERSGLFFEVLRLLCEIRPQFAILENISNLLRGERGAWFSRVLGSLADVGYNVQWHVIRASNVNLPHSRERVWIIINTMPQRWNVRLYNKIAEEVGKIYKQPSSEASISAIIEGVEALGDSDDLRIDDGIRKGLDKNRLGMCGNAVVPQIPEIIGKAILEIK